LIHKKTITAPRTILIICMRLIGDVILATPLIELLKTAYPEAEIDFLVNRKTGEFLEKDPRVRKVLYNERFDVGTNRHLKGKGYFGAIFQRYDMAIHLNYADRGSYAAFFAGRRYRVGFYVTHRRTEIWKRLLFSHPMPHPPRLHRVCFSHKVAQALDIPVERLACRVFWDAADAARVAEVRAKHGIGGKYFVIHPFTRGQHKVWRMEHFAAVSDAVAARYGLQPVWTSSPDPEELKKLADAVKLCRIPPAAMAGELTLNQIACLLKDASLYLGLDTAITHLAAAVGIPKVVLHGATSNLFWFPWNNDLPIAQQELIADGTQWIGNTIVVQKDWECVPCGKQGCLDDGGESRCLMETGPEEVLTAIGQLLGAPSPRPETGKAA
jgi:heptosyltransferase III